MPVRFTGVVGLVVLLNGCLSGGDGDGGGDADGDNDPACSAHGDCRSDEICYLDECEKAFDRRYFFTIVDVDVGTSFPTGGDWDAFGGAPDLYVCFGFIAQEDVCCTGTKDDAFSATWNERCSFVMPSGGRFDLEVYDEDAVDDDFAAGWFFEGNDVLRDLAASLGDTLTQTDNSGTVKVRMQVHPDF